MLDPFTYQNSWFPQQTNAPPQYYPNGNGSMNGYSNGWQASSGAQSWGDYHSPAPAYNSWNDQNYQGFGSQYQSSQWTNDQYSTQYNYPSYTASVAPPAVNPNSVARNTYYPPNPQPSNSHIPNSNYQNQPDVWQPPPPGAKWRPSPTTQQAIQNFNASHTAPTHKPTLTEKLVTSMQPYLSSLSVADSDDSGSEPENKVGQKKKRKKKTRKV